MFLQIKLASFLDLKKENIVESLIKQNSAGWEIKI